jgi:hypothetical protein
MSDPIVELIAKNLETSIDAITTVNGYHQNLVAYRPKRVDWADVPPEDLFVLIQQAERNRGEPPIQTDVWYQVFRLGCIVLDSDASTDPIDTRINTIAADIEKKLMVDYTRGGYAQDTSVEELIPDYGENGAITGFSLMVKVKYRIALGDPFTRM